MNMQLIKFPITNIVQAKSAVSTILRTRGYEIDGGHGAHQLLGKYSHFYYTEIPSGRKHWIKHVREPFKTFTYKFREQMGKGAGETIDLVALDCLEDNDIVYFAYPNAIYFITAGKIRDAGSVRTTENNEKTISFDIRLLERFDEE